MKAHLEKLDRHSLEKIANDVSIKYTNQKETAKLVSEYYRAYGLQWVDMVARYEIKDNKINSN